MTPFYQDDWLTVYGGDCREVMAGMEPESVHCVVTSPPFWGLRDYGVAGQLGLEPTPEEYVANLVAVFREVRRVLRADGTVWLNLGDSYASHDPGGYREGEFLNPDGRPPVKGQARNRAGQYRPGGLKPKDLVGIPWRVAFALQADGWVLRSEIVWAKPNPMPESVTDRPTKSHEQMFLFSKGKRIGPEPTKYDDISDSDARWLAGIIDTEGSIVLRREAPKGTDYGAHAAQVSVGNTSHALLEEVARIAGSGSILERGGLNAPMFYWQASNKVALGILRRIYPFLIVKQRQARCAIALEEGKRYPGGHARIATTEVDRRERLWQAVKSLNHFGDPDLAGIPAPVFGRWTSQRYYFDAEAVREPMAEASLRRYEAPFFVGDKEAGGGGRPGAARNTPGRKSPHMLGTQRNDGDRWRESDGDVAERGSRNIRSVWTVATQPYTGAHFAVFPEKLVEPCILAGTSERGVCPECGAPWVRVVERVASIPARENYHGEDVVPRHRGGAGRAGGYYPSSETAGWQPTCTHTAEPIGATVLDPFAGSGTVGRVANRLSRRAVFIDLNPDYLTQQMARNRDIPLGLGA